MLVVVRGDHRVNEIKLRNAPRRGASGRRRPTRSRSSSARPGTSARSGRGVPIAARRGRRRRRRGGWVAGANRPDAHLRGVEPGRDFQFERGDVRTVEAGDLVDGDAIRIEPAIEVGNIFKLGTRYTEPLGATYLDEDGQGAADLMGSYGIGPARIVAAAIEQFADEQGISWPRVARAVATVHLVGLGKPGTPEREAAESLYAELLERGRRGALRRPRRRPGGEVRRRRTARLPAAPDRRPPDARGRAWSRRRRRRGASQLTARRRWARAPPRRCEALLTRRCREARRVEPRAHDPRFFGPRPLRAAAARRRSRAQPLRPWTIPNAIGYVRLALIPVFLVLALEHGRRGRRPGDRLRGDRLGRLRSTASPRASPASTAAWARCSTRSSTGCS